MSKVRQLACACCGGDAGRFVQWWNQDTGFGICASCVAWLRADRPGKGPRETADDIRDYYGVEGVNYAAPPVGS